MISKPVEQKKFTDVEDYNMFWENSVSSVLEGVFQTPERFLKSYRDDFGATVRKISSKMQVVPIDIRFIIVRFYEAMIKEADNA